MAYLSVPKIFKTSIYSLLCFVICVTAAPVSPAHAGELVLPAPGTVVGLSPANHPPMLKGIKIHPDDPFRFEFILYNSPSESESASEGEAFSEALAEKPSAKESRLAKESTKLIKYFLASLTVPEKDLWVNLSPYEKDRIVPVAFGKTEMGRDLLAQDYLLKQLTAGLIYPEGETGKHFWNKVYAEATKRFGSTAGVAVNTFNKVWIMPDKAVVYENAKAGTAYVVESRLKVMLEQDYVATQRNRSGEGAQRIEPQDHSHPTQTILREIIIPQLTKEVNEGKNFAPLRQVYNSLILANWYKKKIKDSILAQVYSDQNKIEGLQPTRLPRNDGLTVNATEGIPARDVDAIYQRYLAAFKKGAYNYIREEVDPLTHQPVPRKYFSGGMTMDMSGMQVSQDKALISVPASKDAVWRMEVGLTATGSSRMLDQATTAETLRGASPDRAMRALSASSRRKGWTRSQLAVPLQKAIKVARGELKGGFEVVLSNLRFHAKQYPAYVQWAEPLRLRQVLSKRVTQFVFHRQQFHVSTRITGRGIVRYKVWSNDPLYFIEFTTDDVKSLNEGKRLPNISRFQVEQMFFPPVNADTVLKELHAAEGLTSIASIVSHYDRDPSVLEAIAARSRKPWARWIALGRLMNHPERNAEALEDLEDETIAGRREFMQEYRKLHAQLDELLLGLSEGYTKSDLHTDTLNKELQRSTDKRLDLAGEKFILLLNHSLYPKYRHDLLPKLRKDIFPQFAKLQHPLMTDLPTFDLWLPYSIGGYHTAYVERAGYLAELTDMPWASAILFAGNGPHTRFLFSAADMDDIKAQKLLIHGFIGALWEGLNALDRIEAQGSGSGADALKREVGGLVGALLNGMMVQLPPEMSFGEYLQALAGAMGTKEDAHGTKYDLLAVIKRIQPWLHEMPDYVHYVDGLFGNLAVGNLSALNPIDGENLSIVDILTSDGEAASEYRHKVELYYRHKYSRSVMPVEEIERRFRVLQRLAGITPDEHRSGDADTSVPGSAPSSMTNDKKSDRASVARTNTQDLGGIDLTAAQSVTTAGAGRGDAGAGLPKFHFDPAQLQQWRDVRGLQPVIFNILPLPDLRQFLET